MVSLFPSLFRFRAPRNNPLRDAAFEASGLALRKEIQAIFGRSLAIREVDAGSDNAAEIELNNLSTPYYDIERFGVSFVASPRHADVMVITGAVTRNMEAAVLRTWDAMPSPKFVIAVGDGACDGGLFRDSYAVRGGVDRVLPVDLKIPGDPPTPLEIMTGLCRFMEHLRKTGKHTR
jgi:Ni,Fe-hydrogenase III small subunit